MILQAMDVILLCLGKLCKPGEVCEFVQAINVYGSGLQNSTLHSLRPLTALPSIIYLDIGLHVCEDEPLLWLLE
jgi:hypothetical protein